MKRCPTCNTENADAMQFCLQCGTSLANAPFVVNFQGGQQQPQQPPSQSNSPFGQPSFPHQFSNVPPSRPKSNSKMFLIIGGVLALFLLLFLGGAAIFVYNYAIKDDVVDNKTPTPSPSRSNDKSSPDSTDKTLKSSPTASPFSSNSVSNTDTDTKNSGDASATFDKQWVDYGVTENGRSGMRIHTTFTVSKLKGVDSYLAVLFQKKDGSKLVSSSSNSQYHSQDGQVAVYSSLKPEFDETVYKDLQVFIPYDELSLKRGKYNLKIDTDVIYKNGDLVEHLNYYDFEYEKY